jgi:hypothetical protein
MEQFDFYSADKCCREWTWRYAMLDVLPVSVLPASTFAIHDRDSATHEQDAACASTC